jgi:anti-sigma factor RsiW
MSAHERYETLLMRAVDDVLSDEESAELDEHMTTCASCIEELADFRRIKETTNAMTQRILQDAKLQPPHESGATEAVISLSFLMLLAAALLLLGFAGYTFTIDTEAPMIVKVGAGLAAAGSLLLLGYVLRSRTRGNDPYKEIDQ